MFKQFLENKTQKNQELKKLYLLIHKYGPIRRTDLIEKTKIKKTTLTRMIDELLNNKFIKESGYGESSVGRPPILYDVESECNYIIGVHVSRMKTNIVLLDLRFNQIDQESFVMTSIHTPEFVIMKLESIINGFMENHNFNEKELMGIGLAIIGPLNQKEGVILSPNSLQMANWENVRIVEMIRNKFPVKILLEKSPNAAVVAEYHALGSVHKNILYCISGGWGMDCGVLIDGTILQDHCAGGNGYGHMIIDIEGEVCSCGKRGCIVAYTSFKGILQVLKKENALVGSMKEEIFQEASYNEMMEYFMQGDQVTEDVIIRSSRYLGIGLSNLVNLFNPELVILNGPFIYEFNNYYSQVVENIEPNVQKEKEIVYSQGILKDNAAAVGAAILLFDSYFINQID